MINLRYLFPLGLIPLCGCSALHEIQDSAEVILSGVVSSGAEAQVVDAVVGAVTNPGVVSATEATLALVATIAGGIGAFIGHKKGRKRGAK